MMKKRKESKKTQKVWGQAMVGRYNDEMVDREHDRRLDPPDDDYEEYPLCCMCNHPAEYSVMGDYYCECCLHSEFRI